MTTTTLEDIARDEGFTPLRRGLDATCTSRTPMPTVAEIDEALFHLSLVPEAERGAGWHASLDARLAQRARLAAPEARRRTTRVLEAPETR